MTAEVPLNVLAEDPVWREIAGALRQRVRGEVLFDRHDRQLYATDASIYQQTPIGVVIPRDLDDVRAVVELCADRGLPLLSRGGGTSLAGQAVNAAVVLDFSRWCNAVLELDPATRVARVEPGVVLDDLNRAAAAHGLMFGPDVASALHATLGGMIGNNSAGARSILYGRTVEHVETVDALLADGAAVRFEEDASRPREAGLAASVAGVVGGVAVEIESRFPRVRRRVNGYNLDLLLAQKRASTPGSVDRLNLASLLCGSEGTLAVMTAATVRLVSSPKAKGLALAGFADVDEALRRLEDILRTSPSAVELIDDVVIELARGNRQCAAYVDLLPRLRGRIPGAVLYVEHFGATTGEVAARQAELARVLGDTPLSTTVDEQEMQRAWTLRRSGEPLLHGLPGARKPITFVEDLAVAPAKLPGFVIELRELLARHGTRAAFYAHASVGCLHVRPLVDQRDAGDRVVMEAIVAEATDLVRRYGGALSGEHGDGRLRSPFLERFYGAELVAAFAEIKALFDPAHRLNPGNIVDPPAMLTHLRLRPDGRDLRVPAVATRFRFGPEHGFEEAVERCNGAGVCRKMHGGTMCPSYRATRAERHATRGRGNALRLAISGQIPGANGADWRDPATLETLDLCLSCKACKSECPSNVDLAKLKSEYLAQGYRAGRSVPIADRLFARVRTLHRLGALIPGPANVLASWPPARALVGRLLGLDPRRSLPRCARSARRAVPRRPVGARPTVVLFADCFCTYSETAIARAAIRVLEAFGYAVVMPRTGCCARPMISLGLLDQAAAQIERTARPLLELLETGGVRAVVGLEPSCVSAIRDDWTDLRCAVAPERLADLADATCLVEEFLESRWDEHPRRPELRTRDARFALHGHCHQKTLWGVDTTARLLKRVAGEGVETLETGCCGMAGAFGFTRDHYDLSLRIAELELFPALRDRPDAVAVAPGTSCRHQIRDGLRREALHPIEIVADALPEAC